MGRQNLPFAGVKLVQHGLAYRAGGQVESDTPGLDADNAGKTVERQIDRVQAGDQRRTTAGGINDQALQAVLCQNRIEGGNRLVGQDQDGLLLQNAGDADALQLAAGELVATLENFVGQVEPGQRFACAGNIERIKQRGQRFPDRPLAAPAG